MIEHYTAFIACEHGYLTGIPTADAQTWVYSYDSDITTEEEAVKDFNKHCEVKKHCSYKKTELRITTSLIVVFILVVDMLELVAHWDLMMNS